MKKTLSILLTTALLFGLLTACSKTAPAEIPSVSSQTVEAFKQDLAVDVEAASKTVSMIGVADFEETEAPAEESISIQKYCGSRKSDVFHYSSCFYVERIKDSNLIWFKNSDAAYDRGYRPCQRCTPD